MSTEAKKRARLKSRIAELEGIVESLANRVQHLKRKDEVKTRRFRELLIRAEEEQYPLITVDPEEPVYAGPEVIDVGAWVEEEGAV